MSAQDTLKINVRVSGSLRSHVEHAISDGDFENVSEYVRDLIRKDKAVREVEAFEKVKTHLQSAFAVPDDACVAASFDDIKSRALKAR